MRILALEPYHGGSHKAFLDGWIAHSRHDWTVLGLPPFKWKWRMRHAPITFADDVAGRVGAGEKWDAIFCSDMLNLPEFLGLAPDAVHKLPSVAYFHENQLTYPYRFEDERDYQYCFSNMATALAATEAWFNSAFHRDEFLEAIPVFLRKMPDHQPWDIVERIRAKSHVRPPGIAKPVGRGPRSPGPLRILWAARWEHDKDPDSFFEALRILKKRGVDFRVSVVGETFRGVPPCFARAKAEFAGYIGRWGYQESRADYEVALAEADVVVSTAQHEFFGISVVEAVAAGCLPVLPRRLAYPEIFGEFEEQAGASPFYEGGAAGLAGTLAELAERTERGELWPDDPNCGVRAMSRFFWENHAADLDGAVDSLIASVI